MGQIRQKNKEPEQEPGAPEWMVTFSDCMTLLLTFFVLLLSFSTFSKLKFDQLSDSLGQAVPGIEPIEVSKKESLITKPIKTPNLQDESSNTPTQEDTSTHKKMKERDPRNFRELRVFSMPSEQAFLASGKALSPKAKETLDLMAQFLDKMPSRIVICETGPEKDLSNPFFGYKRAFEIMDYLKSKGVPEKFMNITESNMTNQNSWKLTNKRQLQITLLERAIYEP